MNSKEELEEKYRKKLELEEEYRKKEKEQHKKNHFEDLITKLNTMRRKNKLSMTRAIYPMQFEVIN
jgi:hypothetical protein